MTPSDFEARVQQLLDARAPLAEDETLQAAAAADFELADLLAGFRELESALAFGALPAPRGDFTARVLAEVLRADDSPAAKRDVRVEANTPRVEPAATAVARPTDRAGAAAWLAAAAVLALCVAPLLFSGSAPTPSDSAADARLASTGASADQAPREFAPAPDADSVFGWRAARDDESAIALVETSGRDHPEDRAARSGENAPATSDAARPAPGQDDWQVLRTLGEHLPEMPIDGDTLVGGIRPITDSLGAAFDILRRSLPGASARPWPAA